MILQLLASDPAGSQTVFTKDDFGKAALAAEGLLPDGIEMTGKFFVAKKLCVQLSVLHEDLVYADLGIIGMLVFAAQGF